MRYFVVVDGIEEADGCYVLAEVVRDLGEDKELTLAGALAGAEARIVSRTELERSIGGRRALLRWRRGDDTDFDGESAKLATSARTSGSTLLRPVVPGERPTLRKHRTLPRRSDLIGRFRRFTSLREIRSARGHRSRARRREADELPAPPRVEASNHG